MTLKTVHEPVIAPADAEHPRNDHPVIFPLTDNRLVAAWCRYYVRSPVGIAAWDGPASDLIRDVCPCRIVGRVSSDSGRSFSGTFTLQENICEENVKQPNLLPLPSGEILFFYTGWAADDRRDIFLRRSDDEMESWSAPEQITERGHYCINADHVVMLSTGRVILPAHRVVDGPRTPADTPMPLESLVFWSDDGFKTWHRSRNTMTAPQRGAHEPSVVELAGGRLLCFLRTTLGRVYQAFSDDGGETWTTPEPGPLTAPDATSIVKRIPTTNELLAIWNDNYELGHHHVGERTPLAVAVSRDEGRTWQDKQYLETTDPGNFSTPTVAFVADEALFTYYAFPAAMLDSHRYSVKLKIVRIHDLYEPRP